MPVYEYVCPEGHELERLLPMAEADEPGPCPECDGALRRRFSRVAVKLNGWGFSRTDGMVADSPTRGSFGEMAQRAERIADGE